MATDASQAARCLVEANGADALTTATAAVMATSAPFNVATVLEVDTFPDAVTARQRMVDEFCHDTWQRTQVYMNGGS